MLGESAYLEANSAQRLNCATNPKPRTAVQEIMHQVSIEQATAHIASILGEAMRGEEIVITDHEKPVVKVVPYQSERRKGSTPGRGIGMISYIADDFDETPPGFEEYM